MTALCILLSSFMGLYGCNDNDSSSSEIVSEKAINIRVYMPEWTNGEIYFKRSPMEEDFIAQVMEKDGDSNWWYTTIDANKIEFYLNGDTGVINLGGTQGCYPGDHYLCEKETDPAENFKSSSEDLWIKNGVLYTENPDDKYNNDSITVLSVNFHTYQEFKTQGVSDEASLTEEQALQRVEDHGPLFDKVADAINELQPDIVCLQEVGEWHGKLLPGEDPDALNFGKTETNMINQLLPRLNDKYNYFMDWSHFGWDVWMEGSAILSKVPMSDQESRYISNIDNGTHTWWKSRNVPKARLDFGDERGKVNVYSVHAGWWDDTEEPFQDQYQRLLSWSKENESESETTLFCGDFNQVAATKEQQYITNGTGFSELYGLTNPDGLVDPTIGGTIDGWVGDVGKRIDLFVMNDSSPLKVVQSQRIFTQNVYGRVSDHTGLYAQLKLTDNSAEKYDGSAVYQLYLVGSNTGRHAYRGNRFEHVADGKYRLVTWLGAAENDPENDFMPHRLYISDRSGEVVNLGGETDSEEILLSQPVQLITGSKKGLIFEAEEAGVYQFDLDFDSKSLVITKVK